MRLSFRTRLMIALVVAAILPVAGLGILLWATGAGGSGAPGSAIDLVVLFGLVLAGFAGAALAVGLETVLLAPLQEVLAGSKRLAEGQARAPIEIPGEDELAQLAERFNALAAELEHRDRVLERVRQAIGEVHAGLSADEVLQTAAAGARAAFEMTDARVVLGNPDEIPSEPRIPGDPIEVRGILQAGPHRLGALVGTLPPARTWGAADQALLELFAAKVAVVQASARTAAGSPAGRRRSSAASAVS